MTEDFVGLLVGYKPASCTLDVDWLKGCFVFLRCYRPANCIVNFAWLLG